MEGGGGQLGDHRAGGERGRWAYLQASMLLATDMRGLWGGLGPANELCAPPDGQRATHAVILCGGGFLFMTVPRETDVQSCC
jgi:hypothetical protein